MSRPVQAEVKPSGQRARVMIKRRRDGLVALPSPWRWLGVIRAQKLVQVAYRNATWHARHDGENTAHLSDEEMRQAFLEALVEGFEVQLRAESKAAGCPFPGADLQEWQAVAQAEDVPADWRPEYSQFGRPEDRP